MASCVSWCGVPMFWSGRGEGDRTACDGRRPVPAGGRMEDGMSTPADRAVKPATLRKQRQRARERAAREIEFTRADWALFLHPDRLPQKAGCARDRLRAMVLKELVDNALDAGATATLAQTDPDTWIVTDDGPGLDRAQVLKFFAVDRPMVSTKLLRRPTRGALGTRQEERRQGLHRHRP